MNKNIILAKTSGLSLEEHTKNVLNQVDNICITLKNVDFKYKNIFGKSFIERLSCVAKYHDEGKRNSIWQNACQYEYNIYRNWLKQNFDKTYNDYLKENKSAGNKFKSTKIRHEFYSILYINKKKLPIELQLAIAAHHNKLNQNEEDKEWLKNEDIKKIWISFKEFEHILLDNYFNELNIFTKKIFEISGLRFYLKFADHRASAIEDKIEQPELFCFNYEFPFEEKNKVQNIVDNFQLNENIHIIRAPTGSGKTDAALIWAKKQIQNNKATRLIIAMPTRFTSNSLHKSIKNSISKTGLHHSSSWYFNKVNKEENEYTRLLINPSTVCTIDLLITALTLTREDHHGILFNLANSCLVIDEIDFYDEFVFENLLFLLKCLKLWKVPVLIMSATLPDIFIDKIKPVYYDTQLKINEDTSDNARNRFEIKCIRNYEVLNEIEDLLNLCIASKKAIIYVNTIESGINLYNWFKFKNVHIILYHSRFTETDKFEKEKELERIFGKNSNMNNESNIAILTQIGELSINISADLMISEVCPFDRLIQRVGRLCRFNKNKIGNLYLLNPKKNNNDYPAPYGSYNKKNRQWHASKTYILTLEKLKACYEKDKYFNFDRCLKIVNNIYSEINNEPNIKSKENAVILESKFKSNWLFVPKNKSDKEDTENGEWKCRNIDNNEKILISKPPLYFNNYFEYKSFIFENKIELPIYLFKKLKDEFLINNCDVRIKNETNSINYLIDGRYNFEIGLIYNSKHKIEDQIL